MRWLTAIVLAACGAPVPPAPSLDGSGGDAWTFDKRVTGSASAVCDEVRLESRRGTTLAIRDGARFFGVVPLRAGDNDVVAICRDGNASRRSLPQRWRVRLEDRPRAVARARYAPDDGLILDAGGTQPSPARPAEIRTFAWLARHGNPAPIPGLPTTGREVPIGRPAVDGDYVIDLRVTDADGVEDRAAVRIRVAGGEALVVDAMREHPAWLDDAIVYGIAPFFFGGRLTDVIPRLDALVELGVTTLWLSPVMKAEPGDYGYATIDHFAVRDDFGGDAALRALVEAAHARGLKVVLDMVANHTALAHPYTKSRPDLYEHDARGAFTHYFDWKNLPNLDHDHPETTAWLVAAFHHWVHAFDVDGFRADASWGPAERRPEFWPSVRAELVRTDPDVVMIAEAGALDPYPFHHGFDAAYDWTEALGEWAWRPAFEAVDARRLAAALTANGEGYDPDALIFRFLDNNDTGARFATRYGADRVPASAAVLFTVPGIPALWTGSEVGAALEPYDEGPVLTWEDPHRLTEVYRRLTRLRHATPALRGRALELLEVAPPERVIAYLRPGDGPAQSMLVAIDLGGDARDVTITRTPSLDALLGGAAALRDAYHGETVALRRAGRGVRVRIPDDGVRILVNPRSP